MFGFITKIDLHGTPDHIRIEFAVDRVEGTDALQSGPRLSIPWGLTPPGRVKDRALDTSLTLHATAGAKLAASIDGILTDYRDGSVRFSDFLDRIEEAHATYEREVSQ